MAHEGGWHPLEAVSKLAKMPVVTSLRQVVEKRLRLFEVRRVKAFGKPFVDGREKLSSLGAGRGLRRFGDAPHPPICEIIISFEPDSWRPLCARELLAASDPSAPFGTSASRSALGTSAAAAPPVLCRCTKPGIRKAACAGGIAVMLGQYRR